MYQLAQQVTHPDGDLNGLDPESYLREVLARNAGHPSNRIADLLPWHWAGAHRTAAAA